MDLRRPFTLQICDVGKPFMHMYFTVAEVFYLPEPMSVCLYPQRHAAAIKSTIPGPFVASAYSPVYKPFLLPPDILQEILPLLIERSLILHPIPIPLHTPNLLPIVIRHWIRTRPSRRINSMFLNSCVQIFFFL